MYYNRITSYSSTYLGSYTFSVSQFDSLKAGQFILPDSGTVWSAGQSYQITWRPDSSYVLTRSTASGLYFWKATATRDAYLYYSLLYLVILPWSIFGFGEAGVGKLDLQFF